jgi:BMFP domain-containing protein YqiC
MSHRARFVLPVLGLVLLLPACAPPAAAPVAGHVGTVAFRSAKWIAGYLLGKVAEGVWDSATGKTDVDLLKRRIEELERQSDVRPEHRAELKQLRELVYAGITRAEYERYVSDTSDRLTKIEDRLTKLEQRVDKLEAKQGGAGSAPPPQPPQAQWTPPAQGQYVTLAHLHARGADYVERSVTVSGGFLYVSTSRQSFTLEGSNLDIEVFYKTLSAAGREVVLSRQASFLTPPPVTVVGVVRKYSNADEYYIDATEVRFP